MIIKESFSNKLNEKLNLSPEGKTLKRAIKNIVVDNDDELSEFVSAVVEEVISEKTESLKEEKLSGKYPWFIGDYSVNSDGTGLFLTADGRYEKQHYSKADKMTIEDARYALSLLNSKLKKKTSMNYFLESVIAERVSNAGTYQVGDHVSFNGRPHCPDKDCGDDFLVWGEGDIVQKLDDLYQVKVTVPCHNTKEGQVISIRGIYFD